MHGASRGPEARPAAAIRNLVVRYSYEAEPAVGPVDLQIAKGERVLLLGPSGSGKSTFLLALTGLIPASIAGEVSGSIRLDGLPVETREPSQWAAYLAQFFQDADRTLCGMRVEDEIAFALENRALPEAAIEARVDAAMRLVNIPGEWRRRRTSTLSGGEKQLVALAATLVQEAPVFVADEPTAHLAPQAAARLHRLLLDGGRDRTVLIVDHRLDGLVDSVDRVVVLDKGGVLADGAPRSVFRDKLELLQERGIWTPAACQLDGRLRQVDAAPEVTPLRMEEALAHLQPGSAPAALIARARPAVARFVQERLPVSLSAAPRKPLVRLEGADCAPFLGPVVLRNVDLTLYEGEVLGILGRNGAGKSTLAACLAGLLRIRRGRRSGPVGGMAFQRPEVQFTEGSVLDEMRASLPGSRDKDQCDRTARRVLADWGLADLTHRHPFELSQGQKRRLALATLSASQRWPLLVLDEPLAGLDARGAAMAETDIERLRADGHTLAIVTHDMDFALRRCPRAIVVGEGGILAEGETATLLRDPALLARAGLEPPSIVAALDWLERVPQC